MRQKNSAKQKWFFILSVFILIPLETGFAQLSPGPLHQSHAFLEGIKNCTSCHGVGQQIDTQKCLDCHSVLKNQIQSGKGLHAREGYTRCESCHVEHHGRDFDLIYWKEERRNFDHRLTGFELQGAHRNLDCRKCHIPRNIANKDLLLTQQIDLSRTFLGLSAQCASCHADEHRGQLPVNCLSCHQMDGWQPAPGFDHAHATFKLTGKHRQVDCRSCHPTVIDNLYAGNPDYLKFREIKFAGCNDCHRDVHAGKFGRDCTGCHQTGGWQQIAGDKFDHSLTHFPLEGKHAALNCRKCHLPGKSMKGLKYDQCRDCHSDYHQGQFAGRASGGECAECHTVFGFSPATFSLTDHQKTRFPLSGSHRAIACTECHQPLSVQNKASSNWRFRFNSLECQSCHKDPHDGEVDKFLSAGGCESCHSVQNWNTVTFNHEQTGFPLQGRHREISCSACHRSGQNLAGTGKMHFIKISKNCQDCHRDVHNGQFLTHAGQAGTDCSRCHTPAGWQADNFSHNRDSRFKLEGAHRSVECRECHQPEIQNGMQFVKYKPLATTCQSCHGSSTVTGKEHWN